MRVCLIIPPSPFLLDERVFMSLGVLKVAAMLEEAAVPVSVLDLSGVAHFEEATQTDAIICPATVYGITATSPQMPAAIRICQALRVTAPHSRIILGGPHVTLVSSAQKLEAKQGRVGRATRALRELLGIFDTLVMGDGELAVFHAINGDSPKIVDADDPASALFLKPERLGALPFPARHLVDVGSYHYTIDGERALSLIGQLGCPFECTFSVTGDTVLFTENGIERVEDLARDASVVEKCVHGGYVLSKAISRRVATHTGTSMATHAINEGKRPVFQLTTENGISLKATAEHPFLSVESGKTAWKELRHLLPGDWVILGTPNREWPEEPVALESPALPTIPPGGFKRHTEVTPKFLTEDLAWLTGFIIGDGCLPADGRPEIHVCVTPPTEEKLRKVVSDLFDTKLTIYSASTTTKMKHGWIRSRAAYNFFVQSLGISPANKLRVPELIIRSPRGVVEAFLKGLFDADGYMSQGGQEYLTTISRELADGVARLMLMLRKTPSVIKITRNGIGCGTCYRVGHYRNDRIPTDKAIYRSRLSGQWYWRTPRDPGHFLGVRRRTLRESGLSHPLNVDHYHYVRVRSIVPCLPETVYDIRVEKDHSFIANGLIVHNCGGRFSPFLRRMRSRPPENIIAEIEQMHREYGVKGFMNYDDELNVSKSFLDFLHQVRALQDRLGVEFRMRGFIKSERFTADQAAAMYAAGFRWILVGFESGDERMLLNMNKKATRDDNTRCMEIAHRHGLKVKALMSVGHAGESEESIRATEAWLRAVQPDDFDCTVITTYPGTPYFDEALESSPGVWTYTQPKTGDRLHATEIDFHRTASYYKGMPGQYTANTWTDHVTSEALVALRDDLEARVRSALQIPYPSGAAPTAFEHSMGQAHVAGD